MINDKSLEIAGVTKEDLEAYTPEEQVFQEFIDMLKKYVNPFDTQDRFIPVGYIYIGSFNGIRYLTGEVVTERLEKGTFFTKE